MRKNFFTAALLAVVVMLASCSNEIIEGDIDGGKGETAYIKLSLKGAFGIPETRAAIDESEEDDDQLINDMIVFVVQADGKTFDISPQYIAGASLTGASSNELPKITATTKADKIYIVTNTGSYATGAFKNCTSMDDVKKVAIAIDGNPNTGSNCKYKNVWMAGESTALVAGAPEPDGTPVKTATVQLHYLAAKVFVITENHMTGYIDPALGGKALLEGVALINAGAYTGFVKNAAGNYQVARTGTGFPAQTPFYYNGVVIDKFPNNYDDVPDKVGANEDFVVKSAWANQIGFGAWAANSPSHTTKGDLEDKDAFYIFPPRTENTARTGKPNKTWATIYGQFNANGLDGTSDEQSFWSAAFGGTDGIVDAIEAGNKYILTLELTGNVKPGEKDPTIETVPQNLNIKVEKAEWKVSKPKKIFQ